MLKSMETDTGKKCGPFGRSIFEQEMLNSVLRYRYEKIHVQCNEDLQQYAQSMRQRSIRTDEQFSAFSDCLELSGSHI